MLLHYHCRTVRGTQVLKRFQTAIFISNFLFFCNYRVLVHAMFLLGMFGLSDCHTVYTPAHHRLMLYFRRYYDYYPKNDRIGHAVSSSAKSNTLCKHYGRAS